MKQRKIFWMVIKRTNSDKIVYGFLTYFCLCAFIIWLVEPGIPKLGDAIWYSFSVVTSIGFGDYTSVTTVGRIVSIVLGFYGVIVLALIPGIVASYYMEIVNLRNSESAGAFQYKMEHLEELSKEELQEISEKVKKHKFKL